METTTRNIRVSYLSWTLVLIMSLSGVIFVCFYFEQIYGLGENIVFYSKTPIFFFAGILCIPLMMAFGSFATIAKMANSYNLNALRDFSLFFFMCSLLGIFGFLLGIPLICM